MEMLPLLTINSKYGFCRWHSLVYSTGLPVPPASSVGSINLSREDIEKIRALGPELLQHVGVKQSGEVRKENKRREGEKNK